MEFHLLIGGDVGFINYCKKYGLEELKSSYDNYCKGYNEKDQSDIECKIRKRCYEEFESEFGKKAEILKKENETLQLQLRENSFVVKQQYTEIIDKLKGDIMELNCKVESAELIQMKKFMETIDKLKEENLIIKNKLSSYELECSKQVIIQTEAIRKECDELRNNILVLKSENIEIKNKHEIEKLTIKAEASKELVILEKKVTELDTAKKHIESERENLITQCKLTDQVKKLLDPKGANSAAKGEMGECVVRTMLSHKYYEGAIIVNSSEDGKAGDIYFEWRNVKAIIEVKNWTRPITPKEVFDFKNNIKTQKTSKYKDINCGIFVSITQDTMGHYVHNHQEWMDDIFTVYICVGGDGSILQGALDLANNVVTSRKTVENINESTDVLMSAVINYRTYIIERIDTITKEIKAHRTRIQELEEEQEKNVAINRNLTANGKKYKWLMEFPTGVDMPVNSEYNTKIFEFMTKILADEKIKECKDEMIFLELNEPVLKYGIDNIKARIVDFLVLTFIPANGFNQIFEFLGKDPTKKLTITNIGGLKRDNQEPLIEAVGYSRAKKFGGSADLLKEAYNRYLIRCGYISK